MGESIGKVIKFYKIIPQPTLKYCSSDINSRTNEMFKMAFPDVDYYVLESENSEILMEIIEYTDEYIFAKCSKEENISTTKLLQVRDKGTNEAKPLHFQATQQLETYTFIYIDFTNNILAVLGNKKISKINEHISSYIYSKAFPQVNISIPALKISNIEKALKSYNKFTAFNIKYMPDLTENSEISKLADVLEGNVKIKNATLKISIKECGNVEKIVNKLLAKFPKRDREWEKFEIVARNDYGLDEVVNFYESIYTKNVLIQIDEQDLVHFHWIRDKLKAEIQKIESNAS